MSLCILVKENSQHLGKFESPSNNPCMNVEEKKKFSDNFVPLLNIMH